MKKNEVEDGLVKKPENVFMGTIGALIGSLAGVIVIVLLSRIGFVASVAGLIMAYACVFMYEKLAGSISIKGVIICIIIMILMSVFGEVLAISIELSKIYKIGVFDIVGKFYAIINVSSEIRSAFIKDLLMVLLFNAIGCFGVLKTTINVIKNK